MKNLFGIETERTFDTSAILGDYVESLANDEYYGKDEAAQAARVDDYVEMTLINCERAEKHGVPMHGIFTTKYKKVKHITIGGLRYMNLDKAYKIELFDKLSKLTIGGKQVTLFFPKNGEKFDIGISWE